MFSKLMLTERAGTSVYVILIELVVTLTQLMEVIPVIGLQVGVAAIVIREGICKIK